MQFNAFRQGGEEQPPILFTPKDFTALIPSNRYVVNGSRIFDSRRKTPYPSANGTVAINRS
jgi:hypothetical protein